MFKFNLRENEKALQIYRQSEAVLFKPVLIIFALIFLPWLFFIRYELLESFSKLLLVWTVLVLIYAINKYLLWLTNLYLLTDKRLITINYHTLLSKQVLETPWDRILNISFKSRGLWQTLFNFGAVEVQIAGLPDPLELKNVAHPSNIKDELWQLHQKFSQTQPRQEQAKPITERPLTVRKVVKRV